MAWNRLTVIEVFDGNWMRKTLRINGTWDGIDYVL